MNCNLNKIISFLLSVLIISRLTAAVMGAPFTRSDDEAVFSWHRNKNNKIAITFDDGPHKAYTPEILDILDEYGVKATFFVIGSSVTENGDILRRAVASGHEIANHTYSHTNLKESSTAKMIDEIIKTENSVYEICEIRTKLIRPPEGKYSSELRRVAKLLDYKIVLWTVDTMDWNHTSTTLISDNVISNVKSGDIILFHDYVVGDSPTPEALKTIIPILLSKGYTFVTVSELINSD